ncbi:MAG: hypothetical protein D6820_12465, partial [Lentisphaerae bacterium]
MSGASLDCPEISGLLRHPQHGAGRHESRPSLSFADPMPSLRWSIKALFFEKDAGQASSIFQPNRNPPHMRASHFAFDDFNIRE